MPDSAAMICARPESCPNAKSGSKAEVYLALLRKLRNQNCRYSVVSDLTSADDLTLSKNIPA